MFSTSVGLLLKGLEYYEEKQEKIVLRKEEVAPAAQIETEDFEVEAKEKKSRRGRKKGKEFIDGIKSTLQDIFEESHDVKM